MALRDQVTGLSHIGIRIHELARSRAFYELLGFEFMWGPSGPGNVCALRHRSGLEINFIVNAPSAIAPNILMDVPQKHACITHIALQIEGVGAVEAALKSAGIAITGKRGTDALFVRDPDGNVIELAAD